MQGCGSHCGGGGEYGYQDSREQSMGDARSRTDQRKSLTKDCGNWWEKGHS